MKLLDLLKELDKPKNIYVPGAEEDNVVSSSGKLTIADLSPKQRDELFSKGSIMVSVKDPSRPEVTSASQVINLPRIDQIRKDVNKSKQEFNVFMYSSDENLKNAAKQVNKAHNDLLNAMNVLDKMLNLKRKE
jgi:hypothetical protein